MAWTIYRSTDASAPVLSGQAGALIGVFDACLANGYGAKAAAGWSIAFTGTNKRAYRQGAPGDSAIQAYLRVLNDGSTAGGNKEAGIQAWESMSDIDTGSARFDGDNTPGDAVSVIRASTTADATTRSWILAADERTVYFFAFTGDFAGEAIPFVFGDFYSYVAGDQYRMLCVKAVNANLIYNIFLGHIHSLVNTTLAIAHFVARSYLGTGGAVKVNKTVNSALLATMATNNISTGNIFSGAIARPNPSDGSFVLSPIHINDPATSPAPSLRGVFRGIWFGGHAAGDVALGDTFSGTGDLAGKTFEIVKIRCYYNSSTTTASGYIVLETSDTLPTN